MEIDLVGSFCLTSMQVVAMNMERHLESMLFPKSNYLDI